MQRKKYSLKLGNKMIIKIDNGNYGSTKEIDGTNEVHQYLLQNIDENTIEVVVKKQHNAGGTVLSKAD